MKVYAVTVDGEFTTVNGRWSGGKKIYTRKSDATSVYNTQKSYRSNADKDIQILVADIEFRPLAETD